MNSCEYFRFSHTGPTLTWPRSNTGPILAVFIRKIDFQAQFYTMHGKCFHRRYHADHAASFMVPNMMLPEDVATIIPYLPTDRVQVDKLDRVESLDVNVPREAGANMVRKMRAFQKAADRTYRRFAPKLDNAHKIMAHETDYRYATLQEVASKVLQAPGSVPRLSFSQSTLWAVHRALSQGDRGFSQDFISKNYEILPMTEINVIKKVRQWVRGYQEDVVADSTAMSSWNSTTGSLSKVNKAKSNVVSQFVRKAQILIEKSREHRAVTKMGSIGPSSIKFNPPESTHRWAIRYHDDIQFTAEELDILHFLNIWAARLVHHASLSSIGPMILRATGMYEGADLNASTAIVFLMELGTMAPWQNRVVYNSKLALPGHGFSNAIDHAKSQASDARLTRATLKDSMEDLRTDWGDMEVFCIDASSAGEIDDGVSLEPADGSSYWVHIHVANPSAFIHPEHELAKYACALTESVYFPERAYPMFHPSISQSFFSLAKNRPSITFSAKVSAEGDFTEIKVTPGRIHNVIYLEPQTIDRELAGEGYEAETTLMLSVGGDPPPVSGRRLIHKSLTASQKTVLLKLTELGEARRRKREAEGGISFPRSDQNPSVYGPGLYLASIYGARARQFLGGPIISWEANPTSQPGSKKGTLVSDLMLLACEIAATWCSQRNIPIIFRGNRTTQDLPAAQKLRKEFQDPLLAKHGAAHQQRISEYVLLVGRPEPSASPIPHIIIGAKAYSKVTSPLRRYGDLVAHWQIEAAIRHEASTGISLVGNTDNSYLPFSYFQIQSLLPHITHRELHISTAKHYSTRHWIFQLLFRAFYFQEAKLPDTFHMSVWHMALEKSGKTLGVMKEFNLLCFFSDNSLTEAHGLNPGDLWEVKIVEVDTYHLRVVVDPIRFIEADKSLL